ncbi:hypothetical protein ACS5PN_00095 [Roseateles sp. NT4]|uniref:hypothetical protein n=1 Tax=Roseateles sp. NT4 TaxID=3453715 RepID=UPI003EEE74C1
MLRLVGLLLALSTAVSAPAQSRDDLDNLNAKHASNMYGKDIQPITPAHVQELIGTWYVDYEAMVRTNQKMGILTAKQAQTALTQIRAEAAAKDEDDDGDKLGPEFTVDASLRVKHRNRGQSLPIVVKSYRIELPLSGGVVYRVGDKFYRGSHEMGLIPLSRQRFK